MSDEVLNAIVPSASFDAPFDEELHYRTIKTPTEGGSEFRYQKWVHGKRSWRIVTDARDKSEITSIWQFYQRRKGSFDTFLFENPNDSPVLDEIFATGDGAENTFYLGGPMDIPTGDVYAGNGSLTLERSVGGTGDWASFTNYSFDNSIGRIITSGDDDPLPDSDVLRASYNFMYRVRFAQDKLSKRGFAYLLWSSELEIVQVI